MNTIEALAKAGQSVWLDFISRDLIVSGELVRLKGLGLRGMTSNPTIFDKAIAGSSDYDDALRALLREGKTPKQVYEALAIDDIRRASDLMRSVYDESKGADGFVSLEVAPGLAHDMAGTLDEARRLWGAVDRPNLMIKVPATKEGLPAIETLIGEGVNVNVTLIFSVKQYEEVALAYVAGLEKLSSSGGNVSSVASVASFFISRLDAVVDKSLKKMGHDEMKGKAAIANATVAYASFGRIFGDARWKKLAGAGAKVQRPLWASTGTKDPAYPDTMYVDNLVGPDTVNTLPPAQLLAVLDHGSAKSVVGERAEQACADLAKLSEFGIDLDAISEELLVAGVKSFSDSFDSLLGSIVGKR